MTRHAEDGSQSEERTGLSRRELIKRAAIVGGVAVWGVPLVRLSLDDDGGATTVRATKAPGRGPVAAAFPGTCEPTQLDSGDTVRLICARSVRSAERAFEATVKSECTTKCAAAPCSERSCRTAKRTPTTITNLGCSETGNLAGCPPELYGRGMKEFTCLAVVLCNCDCR